MTTFWMILGTILFIWLVAAVGSYMLYGFAVFLTLAVIFSLLAPMFMKDEDNIE